MNTCVNCCIFQPLYNIFFLVIRINSIVIFIGVWCWKFRWKYTEKKTYYTDVGMWAKVKAKRNSRKQIRNSLNQIILCRITKLSQTALFFFIFFLLFGIFGRQISCVDRLIPTFSSFLICKEMKNIHKKGKNANATNIYS